MFEQSGWKKSKVTHENKGQLLHVKDGKFDEIAEVPTAKVQVQVKVI